MDRTLEEVLESLPQMDSVGRLSGSAVRPSQVGGWESFPRKNAEVKRKGRHGISAPIFSLKNSGGRNYFQNLPRLDGCLLFENLLSRVS